MIKKKKKDFFLDNYKNIISKYKNNLPNEILTNTNKYKTDSWFDINITKCNECTNNINYKTKFPKEIINCKKIKMILTATQKDIINIWFKSCTNMYNKTLEYINKTFLINKNNKKIDRKAYNFIYIRSKLLNEKHNILNNSQLKNNDKNTKIYTHTLDYIIKQLTTNIKVSITNFNRGNIKKFNIKKWKYNRPSQTIDIEKESYNKNGFCYKILGDIKYEYNNKSFILEKLKNNVKINYNIILDEYTLLIPEKHIPITILNKDKNIIVLDPGLRVFMTGLSESESIEIAPNINKIIRKKIKKLNNIKNNELIPNKIKNKYEKNINKKIYNMIDDSHWKIIKYLTSNYKNILIGDMSAKSIVSKNKSVISNESKVACLRSRYYQFRQRLEYKCMLTKTNYRLIDESYTSRICSNCGNCNNNLGGNKIYNCIKCNKIYDRDFNACRNIFMKSII